MVLTDGDYCIRYMDLPTRIKGVTEIDENGFANIYVNARLSCAAQRKAIRHELEHVRRNDAYSDRGIRAVEEG